jgi:hypothetical protein
MTHLEAAEMWAEEAQHALAMLTFHLKEAHKSQSARSDAVGGAGPLHPELLEERHATGQTGGAVPTAETRADKPCVTP